MKVRKATAVDRDSIWQIFSQVIRQGDTYVFLEGIPESDLEKHWLGTHMHSYVVVDDHNKVLGSYVLKPNHPGRGSHVANCSYMVHPDARGKGLGGLLCDHSLKTAIKLGFTAMQFNMVVSSNEVAVNLWKRFGFEIVGTIPDGFNHKELGLVDAYVMWRRLGS